MSNTHSLLKLAHNHSIHRWEVANSSARGALVVNSQDIGKVCFQADTSEFYILAAVTPSVVWWNTSGKIQTVAGIAPDSGGNVTLSKSSVGLANVDNTSDANKPISIAVSAALTSLDAAKQNADPFLDLLSALDAAGNGSKVIGVNAGGTALEFVAGAEGSGSGSDELTTIIKAVVDAGTSPETVMTVPLPADFVIEGSNNGSAAIVLVHGVVYDAGGMIRLFRAHSHIQRINGIITVGAISVTNDYSVGSVSAVPIQMVGNGTGLDIKIVRNTFYGSAKTYFVGKVVVHNINSAIT